MSAFPLRSEALSPAAQVLLALGRTGRPVDGGTVPDTVRT